MIRKLREAREEEGFTLIELLVVVLIIGILAAIAIPVFLNQREKAFRDDGLSALRNGAIVMEDHFSDNFVYPADVTAAGLQVGSPPLTVTTVTGYASGGYCLSVTHASLAGEGGIYDASTGAATARAVWNDAAVPVCPVP